MNILASKKKNLWYIVSNIEYFFFFFPIIEEKSYASPVF